MHHCNNYAINVGDYVKLIADFISNYSNKHNEVISLLQYRLWVFRLFDYQDVFVNHSQSTALQPQYYYSHRISVIRFNGIGVWHCTLQYIIYSLHLVQILLLTFSLWIFVSLRLE